MQDIQSLEGGATPSPASLFAAAATATAADHHLRTFHHHLNPHPNGQALKCPRCDSLNTKFCYYNNYNLSQPRHFCKSCRRYWTKGGVLRNVPIGGGCRKSRRSSSSSRSALTSKPPSAMPKHRDDTATASVTTPTNNNCNNNDDDDKNNLSSSDSSTLSAAATAEPPSLFHKYGSSCLKPSPTEMLYGALDVGAEMGNFAGMMGSTAPFGDAGALIQQHDARQRKQPHQQGTAIVDGFVPLDWGDGGRGEENYGGDRGRGLFEVTGAMDYAYWDQNN